MSIVALLTISGLAALLVITADVLVSERRRRRALRGFFSKP
jgi:hypothetical protein